MDDSRQAHDPAFQTYSGDPLENRRLAEEFKHRGYDYPQCCRHIYWRKRSVGICERDNYQCRRCEARDIPLQTHHCYYRYYPDGLNAVPWDYPDDSLITLREKCHRDEERMIKPTKADLIAAMAERGASSKDFRKLAAAFRAVKLEKDVKYLVDVISKWMKQESALEHMVKVYEDAEARKKTKVIAKNGRR